MWWNRASHFQFVGKSMKTETTSWSELLYGGKAIIEQILVSEEINIFKRAGLWEPQSGNQVGILTTWVKSFKTEKL